MVIQEDEINIGDEVELLDICYHNSVSQWYDSINNNFKSKDIGSKLTILDFEDVSNGAYKVATPTGYTALRRDAFKLVKKKDVLSSVCIW